VDRRAVNDGRTWTHESFGAKGAKRIDLSHVMNSLSLGVSTAVTAMARQNGAMVDHFICAYARFVFDSSVL
jgi:hypothetical protein